MEEKLEGMMVLVMLFYGILRKLNKNNQQNVGNLVFTYGSGPSTGPARTTIVVIRVNSACVGSICGIPPLPADCTVFNPQDISSYLKCSEKKNRVELRDT